MNDAQLRTATLSPLTQFPIAPQSAAAVPPQSHWLAVSLQTCATAGVMLIRQLTARMTPSVPTGCLSARANAGSGWPQR